jgi:hypothetical protein
MVSCNAGYIPRYVKTYFCPMSAFRVLDVCTQVVVFILKSLGGLGKL